MKSAGQARVISRCAGCIAISPLLNLSYYSLSILRSGTGVFPYPAVRDFKRFFHILSSGRVIEREQKETEVVLTGVKAFSEYPFVLIFFSCFNLRVYFALLAGIGRISQMRLYISAAFSFWGFLSGNGVVRKGRAARDLGVLIMNEENPRLRSDLETLYFVHHRVFCMVFSQVSECGKFERERLRLLIRLSRGL